MAFFKESPWHACFLVILIMANYAESIGVNWGTQTAQPLYPPVVVQMLRDNHIPKVKLFDSDHWTVKFFAGSGIEVMLGIPNDRLEKLSDYDNAKDWVKENVSSHMYDGGANIRYVAVGNEPFLKSYNGTNMKTIFPALKNVQKALNEAGLGDKIKATIPQNGDVYDSSSGVPSAGNFRSDIRGLMVDIVNFLKENNAPFLVNIYPFLSLYQSSNFPIEFAFFDGRAQPVQDGNIQYSNMFDANLDTLAWSLKKSGASDMKIVVGEIGWPTDSNIYANPKMAQRFYSGLLKKLASNKGTPLHPGHIDVYLFSLTDENLKSIAPGSFERHWGIFQYDGKPKFPIDFSGQGQNNMPVGAKNVQYLPREWCVLNVDKANKSMDLGGPLGYACSLSDCTSMEYGGSCNKLGRIGNVSYAFNSYFQMNNQDVRACDFDGLAMIAKQDPSTSDCRFPIALESAGKRLSSAIALMSSLAVTLLISVSLF